MTKRFQDHAHGWQIKIHLIVVILQELLYLALQHAELAVPALIHRLGLDLITKGKISIELVSLLGGKVSCWQKDAMQVGISADQHVTSVDYITIISYLYS